MKKQIDRYYFDYNIFEEISKKKLIVNKEFIKNNDIFLSVAHIEEYYKAYKNDKKNKYTANLNELKSLMLDISKKGVILQPHKRRGVWAKRDTFNARYEIIKKFDTRDAVEKNGKEINSLEKKANTNLREHDKMVQYNSTLDKEKIWERPEVIHEISAFEEYYRIYPVLCFDALVEYYGIDIAMKDAPILPENFKLCKDCFKNNIPTFSLLECVMEYLHGTLGRCGYHRDKKVEKTVSGIHDVTHSIYATYCNYFVTLDNNLSERTDAIYFYLGLNTELITFKNLKEKGLILQENVVH